MAQIEIKAHRDLSTICEELAKVKHRWFDIGLKLRIPYPKLKEFEDTKNPLVEVINYWLTGNVKDVPIMWRSVVTVLESSSVNERGLAKLIMEKFCQSEPTTSNDGNVAQVTDTESEIPSSVKDKKQMLQHILSEIREQFSCYVDQIRSSIKQKGISADELAGFLLTREMCDYNGPHGRGFKLFSERKEELMQADNVDQIFNLLVSEYCSFLNFKIFQHLVERYKLDEGQEELKYPAHLEKFINANTIPGLLDMIPKPVKLTDASIKFVVKLNIEYTSTIARLKNLEGAIADLMNWKESTLRIYDVEGGCVKVTYLISASLATTTFTHDNIFSVLQKKKYLELGVLSMECNGFSYNFNETVQHDAFPTPARRAEDIAEEMFLLEAKIINMKDLLTQLYINSDELEGKYLDELRDCNRHLSAAREAGFLFIQSVFTFFSKISTRDEEIEEFIISLESNDFTLVKQYFGLYQDYLQECKHLHSTFVDKLLQAYEQCEKTKQECKQKEGDASLYKNMAMGASITALLVLASAATASFLFTAGGTAPVAVGLISAAAAGVAGYTSHTYSILEEKFKKLYKIVESAKDKSDEADKTMKKIAYIVRNEVGDAYINARTDKQAFVKLLHTVNNCNKRLMDYKENLFELIASLKIEC